MRKARTGLAIVIISLFVLLAVGCVFLWLSSPVTGYVAALLSLMAAGMTAWLAFHVRRLMRHMLNDVARTMDMTAKDSLSSFPLPAAVLSTEGEILYCNDRMLQQICGGESPIGQIASKLFTGLSLKHLADCDYMDVSFHSMRLTVHAQALSGDSGERYVLYFYDDTALKDLADEYYATRPVVLLIEIDSLEESTAGLRDSDRSRIAGEVETRLDEWLTTPGGVLRKYATGRYMAITEKRCFDTMTAERFPILDQVRGAFPEVRQGITLSIGIGQGATLQGGQHMARQALDMAQARGGDQVAVKTDNGYDFYGGRSKGIERRTKVRARLIATALKEMIADSDRVFVMGHRLSDLDSLGSAVAMTAACRRLGIRAHAVVRRNATMAAELVHRYEAMGQGDLFIEPDEAMETVTERTLLIITDTHSPAMLDSRPLYERAKRVVVIDHHRRMVDHIDNAALQYHEPSSSSACELVAELLPYMGEGMISSAEAESMLAGIMLDTRNFVLRTGVRTFEAAAALRRYGADTVSVKRMFADSLEMYRKKSALVTRAVMLQQVAIAVSDEDYANYRAAAAQASDELLSISDTVASFVVFRVGRDANISARSYGECNVQVILEKLGGGGHLTMAGAQLKDISVQEAEKRLREQIEIYFQQNG